MKWEATNIDGRFLYLNDSLQCNCSSNVRLSLFPWVPSIHGGVPVVVAIVVQLLSCVLLFETPWTAACQGSMSLMISWSLLKFMSIESVMISKSKFMFIRQAQVYVQ